MALSSELISQFAKITNDTSSKKSSEATLMGTVVGYNDSMYVRIDGSDLLTPFTKTTNVVDGERVTVRIADHTATVTGNTSSPAARTDEVAEVDEKIDEVDEKVDDVDEKVDDVDAKVAEVDEKIDEVDEKVDDVDEKVDDVDAKVDELSSIVADKVDTKVLEAEYAHITNGIIDNATIDQANINNLEANYAKIQNGVIGNATIDQANVNNLDANYAKITNGYIDSGVIKDGSIADAKIIGVSANKLTVGTIDASKITVTNLNADNLTVGTINGKRIGNESITLDKLAEEVPTKGYLDKLQENLQNQIDGAIETFTTDTIPLLSNYPASTWTDAATRKKHVGDVCYVVNAGNSADGFCYRFAENQNGTYEWVLIKDSDVTAALQRLLTAEGDISGLQSFETSISSWKTDTDAELSSLKSSTTSLTTRMETAEGAIESKLDTSVFNEVKQTVDENSSTITTLTTKVDNFSVGGRNLYLGTRDFTGDKWQNLDNWETWDKDEFPYTEYGRYGAWMGLYQEVEAKAGEKYIFSFMAKGSENARINVYFTANESETEPSVKEIGEVAVDEHTRYEVPFEVLEDCILAVRVENTVWDSWLQVCALKLEKGTVATDWSPAPEDGENAVTTVSNTVNQVKQTADENKASISSLTKTVENKADGSTVEKLTERTSKVEQDLSGFKSTVSSTYTTKTDFDNLSIGGVNLLLKTAESKTVPSITNISAGFALFDPYDLISAYKELGITAGDYITLSFDWTVKSAANGGIVRVGTNASPYEYFGIMHTFKESSESGHFTKSYCVTDTLASSVGAKLRFRFDGCVGMQFTISNAKLETGNVATDWTPAPEDVDSRIDSLISDVDVEYYLSTSSSTLAGGSWTTTAPTWADGKYMWTRTKTTDGAGNVTYAPSQNGTCIAGAKGNTGNGISKIEEQYYKSTSATSLSGGSWSTTYPGWESGKYIWTRSVVTYTSGSTTTTTAVCVSGTKGDTGNGIKSTSITYQAGSSGTTAPTGTWSSTPVTTSFNNQYLWTKTVITYTDNTTSSPVYAVGSANSRTYTLNAISNSKCWSKLGTLTSLGDNSIFTIKLLSGDGYNGAAYQNSQAEIVIKDGWQSTKSTTEAFGVSITRQNCEDLTVDVRATAHNICDVWAYLPWNYSWGCYTIDGKYSKWDVSMTTSTTAPTEGVSQDVAYRMNAENASKTATNMMNFGDYGDGLTVGDLRGDSLGKNTYIDADGVAIRDGSTEISRFNSKSIRLGKTSAKNALIDTNGMTIKDGSTAIASFGANSVRLGKTSAKNALIDANGMTIKDGSTAIASFGEDNIKLNGDLFEFSSSYAYSIEPVQNEIITYDVPHCGVIKSTDNLSVKSNAGFMTISNSTDKRNVSIYCGKNDELSNYNPDSEVVPEEPETDNFGASFFSMQAYANGSSSATIHADNLFVDANNTFCKPGEHKILWSGEVYMNADQTRTLSENISRQLSGAVFAWSAYKNGSAQNYDWNYFFVPKNHVISHSGNGVWMINPYVYMCKYLYISNGNMTGRDINGKSGTFNGIAYDNTKFVLRYVIGV